MNINHATVGFKRVKNKKQTEVELSKSEIYLNQDQVKNLKSILNQSELGFHLLFDNQSIHEAFQAPFSEEDFFQVENIKKIQSDLLKLLQLKSLIDKQEFIRCLSEIQKNRLIRAYFFIIENQLQQSQKMTH